MIFTPMRLTKAVNICFDLLQKVAERLTPKDALDHQNKAARFITAAKAYDEKTVNQMLRVAMQSYLHTSALKEGMERYCGKFGIEADFSAMSETEAILFIARQGDKIARRLKEEGV